MRFSKRSLEGELMIDHRDSPGVPDAMIAAFERQTGRSVLAAPAGQLVEEATLTCCHCQRTYHINRQRSRPREVCRSCDAYVCDDPICVATCTPIAKLLDLAESAIVHQRPIVLTDAWRLCV